MDKSSRLSLVPVANAGQGFVIVVTVVCLPVPVAAFRSLDLPVIRIFFASVIGRNVSRRMRSVVLRFSAVTGEGHEPERWAELWPMSLAELLR